MHRILAAVFLALVALPASAQSRIPSHCIAVADAGPERLWRADWRDPVARDTVRIRYIDHSMFLIQTPGGLAAATDFTGFLGPVDLVPDVVTMNHAHSSHWTSAPDPRIPHVLPGWGPFGQGIEHHLDLGEMLVRNVSTDIRLGASGVEPKGNSIFVFEVAGLCIGHLGHLHHEPDAAQYAALGRIDVLMVPVDGGRTLDLPTMMRVVERLRSSVVIPMHWFSGAALDAFLVGMSDGFAVERSDASEITLSLRSLPARPTIVVLRPDYLE
ncbi:MBL fold metallo-hydrolase [Frigidibacter sp. ROC022]|uniref:MBL fold metallo-hydrolase n=1 Tax=Frigidibacter sp. ROC022 TaxID=2971796 RepID=UPI00215A8DD1|nr:MBL fold metallo-hydrolase [Frigidibacter sp. ROC022]MCR8723979.1 MBL fold metallo-hydrolase [Frigidibacter sp. ROC022]